MRPVTRVADPWIPRSDSAKDGSQATQEISTRRKTLVTSATSGLGLLRDESPTTIDIGV